MYNSQYQKSAIDAGACVSQAWELVKRNLGLYVGAGLVTLILLSCSPFLNVFLMGPMMGGIAYLVLRDLRDEPIDFGMLFKGFEKFLPLMLVGLIQAVPAIIFQVSQYIFDISSWIGVPTAQSSEFYQGDVVGRSIFQTGALTGLVIVFVCYFIFQALWNAALTFAVPLIVERNTPLGDAITLSLGAVFSNLGGLIVLVILNMLVGLLGFIACFVGLFVAVPVTWVSYVIAYRQVFPPIDEPNLNREPPSPDAYGNFGRV